MRKFIYAIMLLGSVLALSSCRGEPGRDGMDGLNGLDGFGTIRTIDVKVPNSSWNYSNATDNNYFYAEVNMPEITEDVFDNGMIKMYRTYNYDNADASQIELPYVRPIQYFDAPTGQWFSYTEHVDYEFFIGKLMIFYTVSDFYYGTDSHLDPPGEMRFRIVTIY